MIKYCIFDAYGTLFDVSAAARNLAQKTDNAAFRLKWEDVAALWRLKQLEYSWLRNSMALYSSFWQLTQDSLDYALEFYGFKDEALRGDLLGLYWQLEPYKEAKMVLKTLNEMGLVNAILSNGSIDMLDAAVKSAALGPYLNACLSAQSLGVFKPNPRIYKMILDHYNCMRDEVLFISSNGWDVAGAGAFGYHTIWVNRNALPQDYLDHKPWKISKDLSDLPIIVKQLNTIT